MVYGTETGSFFEGEESSHELNEVELIKLAQEGDQDAFARLWDNYYKKIIQYLSPKVGCENAHDIAQETFLKAWQNLLYLKSLGNFKYWLFKIARNRANDYIRREAKKPSEIPLDTQIASGDVDIPGPEESVEQRELIELALSQVPLRYRSALIWYEREGLPLQEVAKRLNIRETSVGNYLSRGKEEFRRNYYRLLSGQRSVLPKRKKRTTEEKERNAYE